MFFFNLVSPKTGIWNLAGWLLQLELDRHAMFDAAVDYEKLVSCKLFRDAGLGLERNSGDFLGNSGAVSAVQSLQSEAMTLLSGLLWGLTETVLMTKMHLMLMANTTITFTVASLLCAILTREKPWPCCSKSQIVPIALSIGWTVGTASELEHSEVSGFGSEIGVPKIISSSAA